MAKSNEITSGMTTPQALAACARELRELQSYTAIDYEQAERRYGRADSKNALGQTSRPDDKPEVALGAYCADCSVLKELGECSIRPRLQTLAAEHRAQYELVQGGGPGNLNPEYVGGIDGWYDSGWRQAS